MVYKPLDRFTQIVDNNICNIKIEKINSDCAAAKFDIDDKSFWFRKAKKDTKKEGYFVTLYEKNKMGVNHPIKYNRC